MLTKLDQALGFQEAAIKVRGLRQQVLASNIANADTPHYLARDFDFKAALDKAVSGEKPVPENLSKTHGKHLEPVSQEKKLESQLEKVAGVPLQYRTIVQGSVDGNTVDMDVERNQFTDNALHYEASVTMISQQIKNILTVLQG